jgi:hypothetical protein
LSYPNGSIRLVSGKPQAENVLGAAALVHPECTHDSAPRDLADELGSELTEPDYRSLEARWIDRVLADRARLRRVDSITGSQIMGRKSGNCAGIVIPYFVPESERVREYRLRLDQPDLEYGSAGNSQLKQKYLSPPGRSHMLYMPPGTGHSLLVDTGLPIILTEGEFEVLALWRLANYSSPHHPRFFPLAVSGVHNWPGTIGRTVGPDDSQLQVKRENQRS